jgi:hypothetical protein
MERITWIVIWYDPDFFLRLDALTRCLIRLIVVAILVELVQNIYPCVKSVCILNVCFTG